MGNNRNNQNNPNNRPTRTKNTKRLNIVAIVVILCVPLLLWGIHSMIWYLPVSSYTFVERTPDGHVLQRLSSNNSQVATAIRGAFNQQHALWLYPTCTHFAMWTDPPQNTYTYTFFIQGIIVESVKGPANDCYAAEVDSVLSPRIWVVYGSDSIPYTPPPPLSN